MVNKFLAAAVFALALSAGAAHAQAVDPATFDANHDGDITRAEAQAGRAALFRAMDRNADGLVSEAERDAARQAIASRGQQRVRDADSNHDGVISEAEFMNRPYRAFDMLDRNNDGVLSAAETAALRSRLSR